MTGEGFAMRPLTDSTGVQGDAAKLPERAEADGYILAQGFPPYCSPKHIDITNPKSSPENFEHIKHKDLNMVRHRVVSNP